MRGLKEWGKPKLSKNFQQMPKYVPVPTRLGDSWQILTQLTDKLDEFTFVMWKAMQSQNLRYEFAETD